MRMKKGKLAAVITAAALFSAGTSITALAAGWEPAGTEWIYTDNDGDRVTDSWRTSGDYHFWLGSDGIMARDQWVDDGMYYVNGDGARSSDRWIYMPWGSENAPNGEGGWFYVGSNGRLVTNGWHTINEKRYHFGDDGAMDYGWYYDGNENLYYLGDWNDGSMKTGWVALYYDPDDTPEYGQVSMPAADGYEGKWFYFQENGRAVRAQGGERYASRRINGYRYYFDENGVMATGWTEVAEREEGDPTGISTLKYLGGPNEGQMKTGWRYLYESPEDSEEEDFHFSVGTPSEAVYQDYDGEGAWYYFDSDGTPAYLNDGAKTLSDATARINNERYFFDQFGRMRSGLLGFRLDDETVLTAYFGENDSDGAMKLERETDVRDGDWERGTYYFSTSGPNRGAGYTGERNGYLYYNGKLVRAWDEEDYQVFQVNGRLYLVNESGRVQDRNRFYRVYGEYRYEYQDGRIYYVNDDRERIGEVTEGEQLPRIVHWEVYHL